jgi:hypothetical protein
MAEKKWDQMRPSVTEFDFILTPAMVFDPNPDDFGVRGVTEPPALLEPGVCPPRRTDGEGVKEARTLELPIPSLFECLLSKR